MHITMIDAAKARTGYSFVTYGTPEECADCPLTGVCIGNLEAGRKYRITALREKEHECPMLGRMRVVEVEEDAIAAAMNKNRVYLGAKIEYAPSACSKIFCKNYIYCVPEGLAMGDSCRIEDALKNLECELGMDLQLVTLRRA